MKIKFKEPEGVMFGYLKPSVLFRPAHRDEPLSETVYMKTLVFTNEDGVKMNAVNTEIGSLIFFSETYLVVPVDGTFVEGYEDE